MQPDPLTDRQRQVLVLAMHGVKSTQASKMLKISTTTIQGHRRLICDRLGANTIPHAVAIYLRNYGD